MTNVCDGSKITYKRQENRIPFLERLALDHGICNANTPDGLRRSQSLSLKNIITHRLVRFWVIRRSKVLDFGPVLCIILQEKELQNLGKLIESGVISKGSE